jgi:hypothetical protein
MAAVLCLAPLFAIMIGAIVALTWNRDELWRMLRRHPDQR